MVQNEEVNTDTSSECVKNISYFKATGNNNRIILVPHIRVNFGQLDDFKLF